MNNYGQHPQNQGQQQNQLAPINTDKVRTDLDAISEECKSFAILETASTSIELSMTIRKLNIVLTNQVMDELFMPLMNLKVGFLTDRKGDFSYSREQVKQCIIDGFLIGLYPIGNQMNIISGSMYPAKNGYTHLLKRIPGLKYKVFVGRSESLGNDLERYAVKASFTLSGNKEETHDIIFNVKKAKGFTYDQGAGKAERKAKKWLYEYITGSDHGEADANEYTVEDVSRGTVAQAPKDQHQEEKIETVDAIEAELDDLP